MITGIVLLYILVQLQAPSWLFGLVILKLLIETVKFGTIVGKAIEKNTNNS